MPSVENNESILKIAIEKLPDYFQRQKYQNYTKPLSRNSKN
jgi:hypothetical protein